MGLWESIVEGGRDPRLGWFASGGKLHGQLPSGHLLGALECLRLSDNPDDIPFAGATLDEVDGMLAAAHRLEAHVSGLKLALVREVIRHHAPPVPGGGLPDPRSWDVSVLHEVAAVLRISVQSADPLVDLACRLAALPGVDELLDTGVLSGLAAKIIAEEFSVLDPDKLAEAEKRLLGHRLEGDSMTPGRIRRLAQQIADTIDSEGAARRREAKERNDARVRFFRTHGGAGALFASGLPADEALKSEANIQKRALEYKSAGIREKMDFLRVLALVDLTNGLPVLARVALWHAEQADREAAGREDPDRDGGESLQDDSEDQPFPDCEPEDLGDDYPGDPEEPPAASERDGDPRRDADAPPLPDQAPEGLDDWDDQHPQDPSAPGDGGLDDGASDDWSEDGSEDDKSGDDGTGRDGGGSSSGDGPRRGGSGGGGNWPPGGSGAGPVPAGMPDPGLPTLANMTYPLATVLGQAERPGEAPGYGSLDPALVRKLAKAAARSPRSRFCVTFTDEEGHAAAHGCARPLRGNGKNGRNRRGTGPGPTGHSRDGPSATGWDFTRDTASPGPPGGYGSWILTLPGGTRYRVDMHKIPLHDCDHAYATDAYRPSALLRHLVQVRDGECTYPCCSRPPQESDFEHAVPYDQGGATDACNAGMRSRRCHRVKQSPGWTVTQPKPGWHQWRAPSGRTFTKEPKQYPS